MATLPRSDSVGDETIGSAVGAAGLDAARHVAGVADRAGLPDWYASRPLTRDLSLRHGELGIVEALLVRGDSGAIRLARRRAVQAADLFSRTGAGCGTPDGVPTAGLLRGLAGIGHGLLRAGFPDQIPSVLLLAPSPAATERTERDRKGEADVH